MDLQTHKQKLLKESSEFRKEYYSYDLAFEIGQMILEARSRLGVTQKQLAELIGTKQSGVSRAESGNYLPSLSFLNKIAKALKTKLIVIFDFMSKFPSEAETISFERDFISAIPSETPVGMESSIYSVANNNGSKLENYRFITQL
jgi:transcriptional regulator with XRE-family HTH domain